jgi:putative sigma-54 modulation protein
MSTPIQIVAHNFDMTPAIKELATNKLSKLLQHYPILHMHITLSIENLNHTGKALITIKGMELHAQFSSHDMYKTIDGLTEALHNQLKKHKSHH